MILRFVNKMNENVRHVVKTELTVLEMALRRNINDIERLEDQLDGARIYVSFVLVAMVLPEGAGYVENWPGWTSSV